MLEFMIKGPPLVNVGWYVGGKISPVYHIISSGEITT